MPRDAHFLYFLDQKIRLIPDNYYSIGRKSENDIVLPHKGVSRSHALITWENGAFLLEDLASSNGTHVNGKLIQKHKLIDKDKIRICTNNLEYRVPSFYGQDEEMNPSATMILEKQVAEILNKVEDPSVVKGISNLKNAYFSYKEKLGNLAFKDKLTGLFNRRFFDERIIEEWERARRYHRHLSVIMVDIDHFKKFNDTYGHQKGDEVLEAVAQILLQNSRTNDIVARYGGEEMVAILPETDIENAFQVAEKMRKAIHQGVKEKASVETTASFGVGAFSIENDTPEKILKAADEALYRAKEKGRNRVEK